MRCTQCEYRLWNLTTRRCPECGAAFAPSEFEFAPNSVHFCCPHCDQHYFGTSAKGHLEPCEFDCVSCARHIHMDEMVLRPAAGVDEQFTERERSPWLDRGNRGMVRGWLSTVGMALVRPARLMTITPASSSAWSAIWFAILTNILVSAVMILPFSFFFLGIGVPGGGPGWIEMISGLAGVALGSMVFLGVGVVLWGATTHGVLALTGTTRGGIGRTYQAIGYSSGANTASAIPCIGVYVGWIWWVISAVLMVREGQRVGGGRAAVATLLLPVLLVGGIVAFYVWVFLVAIPAQTAMVTQQATITAAMADTSVLQEALLEYVEDHGTAPRHAIELVADNYINVSDLTAGHTDTEPADVPVAAITLEDFALLTDGEREQVVTTCINTLPKNTVAHRLGDFVFTYHGMDLTDPPPDPALVILAADPDANLPPPLGPVIIGMADMGSREWPIYSIEQSLKVQNLWRKENGLPPLVNPFEILHGAPLTDDGTLADPP